MFVKERYTFCGSYLPEDVCFLLKPVSLDYTDVRERERMMQVEGRHYSELLPKEYLPSRQYKNIFYTVFQLNKRKLATHILALANRLNEKNPLVLVSLARAGTPIGVLLKRCLQEFFNRDVPHYSISIILERGIDENALRYILSQHDAQGRDIVFIDGWTGKGGIAREVEKWVTSFNHKNGARISPALYVVSDIAGYAGVAATTSDYVIPSALLNATINGLVSRSVLNKDYLNEDDFHGCKFYPEFSDQDLSLWYVDRLMEEIRTLDSPSPCIDVDYERLRKENRELITHLMHRYRIQDRTLIRPGIGEAIRVLLRRVPDRILLQNKKSPHISPFLILADDKNVPIEEVNILPYQAVGIVSQVKGHS
uniref:PELOTA RNA binding domain-containing protein n=1 Tax=Candidatus Kentrum sp. MB TaxID=2138164 RepID=A0A450XPF6_9GAMM|nr:MAG: PELOTA RNA binding domain-containing protein [Candidatus Kentron sp. MB]